MNKHRAEEREEKPTGAWELKRSRLRAGGGVMEATASCPWEPQGHCTVLVPETAQDRAL